MLCSLLLLALFASAQGRAVNISNTWVLPEEGFPVFYRYFRDRISWYEADAVCQFHHANLVTVDTTAQYDAVRAYLKELDISSAVWVGLIRSNPDGDFTWTDYRGLSGDGYWSSAPDARSAPLCAAADPAADYRWEARACGGPTVASFICELPVPQWALGNEGCMVRALPALTVLYLPESAAVQLTADCGMAGVKRVQCTGNVKHEELLRDLSCAEEDESSQLTNISSTITTWVTTDGDQETNEVTNEEVLTIEHEENPFSSITSTPDLFKHISVTDNKLYVNQKSTQNENNILPVKHVNLDVSQNNNLQSNDIPKLAIHDNFYSEDEKQEDEKHKQHKLLHDELARLGNFENIFSQPTDHFVPPLVMAKAKVNDDMTAVSFEEKLAQQHTEYRLTKHFNDSSQNSDINKELKATTAITTISSTTEMPISSTLNILKDKKEINKHILPKKYDHKLNDVKIKVQPVKITKNNQLTTVSSQTEIISTVTEASTLKNIVYFDPVNEDNILDLTVIIKEPEVSDELSTIRSNVTDMLHEINKTYDDGLDFKVLKSTDTSSKPYDLSTESIENHTMTLNDEIIKITFIHDDVHSPLNHTEFEITTKMPIFKDITETAFPTTSLDASTYVETNDATHVTSNTSSESLDDGNEVPTTSFIQTNITPNITNNSLLQKSSTNSVKTENDASTKRFRVEVTTEHLVTKNAPDIVTNATFSTVIIPHLTEKEPINDITVSENLEDFETNITDTSRYEDDFQSPLLSGANEPLHKPNRSRRPQQPANRIKKFNPFRILG